MRARLQLQLSQKRVEILIPSDGLVRPNVIPILVDAVLEARGFGGAERVRVSVFRTTAAGGIKGVRPARHAETRHGPGPRVPRAHLHDPFAQVILVIPRLVDSINPQNWAAAEEGGGGGELSCTARTGQGASGSGDNCSDRIPDGVRTCARKVRQRNVEINWQSPVPARVDRQLSGAKRTRTHVRLQR